MASYSLLRSRRMRLQASAIITLSLAACSSPSAPRPPTDSNNPAIVTDSSAYTLTYEGGGLGVKIDYVFTNRTGGPVYIDNCDGASSQVLQRWNGSAWVTVWYPVLLECQSAPIVVNAGASLSTRVPVWGALPGSHTIPQWSLANPIGWYRILWEDALSSYDPNAVPPGAAVPLEQRTSNSFQLKY